MENASNSTVLPLTVHLYYCEVETHGNYTCKSWWESQQHTQHMFLPSSSPAHGKAHEPWTPEVKRWEMHSWRCHWLAKKKTERFRYCMKKSFLSVSYSFMSNSLCLIKHNWILVQVIISYIRFSTYYMVKYSKDKWRANLGVLGKRWLVSITLLKGMHLRTLTAQDLGLKALNVA